MIPVIAAAVAALLFVQAVVRLRRRGRPDLAGWDRVALFAAGLGVTLFALDRAARPARRREAALGAHDPARPDRRPRAGADGDRAARAAARLLPARRRSSRRSPATRGVRTVLGTLLRPRVAFSLWAANLAIWHVPYLYDLALEHQNLHDFEHVCWVVLRAPRLDAARRSRLPPAADRRRPRRARGVDVRGRDDPLRRARSSPSRRSIRSTTAPTGSRRSPTSSSRGS